MVEERWWVRVSRRARAHVAETQGGVGEYVASTDVAARAERRWIESVCWEERGGQEGSSEESMEARLIRERARVAGSTSAVDDVSAWREYRRALGAARYKTPERN